MKSIRTILWCLVVFAGAFLGYQHFFKSSNLELTQQNSLIFGAPFELVRHDGTAISFEDLQGRNHAIFFGFTHCPDICPAKLVQAHGWMNELGNDGENLDFYFVSVDPERDTAQVLGDYVTSISPHVTGITGEPQKVWDMLKSYKIFYEKVDLGDDDYTMDHAAQILLIRADGSFQGTISHLEDDETAVSKLRRLSKNS